jgi:polar amino acid transport system permease protein
MSLELVFEYLVSPVFVRGALMTLLLTVCSLLFGVAIGLLIALLQESRSRAGHVATLFYLWLFRGTPVLFQIIFIYNVLPSFGIRLSAFVSAVLALSLNEGAYMAEILRSGLQAVKRGQRIAGLALGMTGAQVMRKVVVPQAARIVLPPIGNQMIGMLKLSALVSVIAVEELLLVANQIASANFRYFEALTAAGIYYLAMTTAFMALQLLLERSLDPKRRRGGGVKPASLSERLLGIMARPAVR